MSDFSLPDLGEGLKEAEIVEWHVTPGDHVVADQPLLAVETEKAVVEIPSPRSGRIAKLLASVGERVKVGAPLVEFEEGAHPDAGTVVGALETASPAAKLPKAPAAGMRAGATKAAPAARTLAGEHDLDLAALEGTGPGGTITRDDVMRALASRAAGAPREPLRGVRLSMARNMAAAREQIVPATIFDDADVEAWFHPAADVMLRLVRALAAAAKAEPALNGWFDATREERALKSNVDLGIAIDTEAGLIVPVLRDAGARDPASLRATLDALIAATRARGIAPADLKGATITLSNFGPLGGAHACLAILPPQMAIVGAGRIAPRAVPAERGAAFHAFLPLSLTFDHRVVSGGEAARFLKAMIQDLERTD